MAVIFENKPANLNKIRKALEDNLNIIPSDSRLSTIVDKITDSRYTFKKVGETGTLPISSTRPTLLYKNWLYVGGVHNTGCGLVIIDINTMEIVKQVFLYVGSANIQIIISDDTHYYLTSTSGGWVVKGLLETGEVLISKQLTIGGTRGMCMDDDYLYTVDIAGKIYKIDKETITKQATGPSVYNQPSHLLCQDGYIYITGLGNSPNLGNIIKVSTTDISTVVATANNNIESTRLLIDGDYLYTVSTGGVVKKWSLADLSYVSDFFTTGTNIAIYTFKKALNNFWVGDYFGTTYRVSETGNLLAKLQTTKSINFVLEVDESNQILYRNAMDDGTIAKYQIIDNLQNSTSTTVIKTTDLISLNTSGTWVDTVYTLNGMSMTCNTLENGYLRQLSFTGTTTADSEFVLAVPGANNKLTPNKSYILNGVKSTDSLSTVFIRLTQYQNPDGSGLNKIIEKEAGDFKVFIAANDDYLYYKIEIVIKSGVTLTNSLYNNIPSMVPSSITYEQGEGPYLIKDLSTITDTISIYKMVIIDGKLFVLPNTTSAGTIEVRDYQTNALLKTINDGANVSTVGICFDNNHIYIAKCVETITDKKYRDVYVRKYDRCTLELILESPVLYTGISSTVSTNSSNIFGIIENGEYLYLMGIQVGMTGGVNYNRIRKIKKTDFSSFSEIAWHTPLNIIKHTNGFFALGGNKSSTFPEYRRIDLLDWDLNVIQTFPQTTLTIQNFRYGFYKDDYLYVGNDGGVLVKYQISTNTIAAETQISEAAIIRNIVLIDDNYILLQTNTSKILLYDLALNFIKMWDFYETTETGGYVISDKNNTIWIQSGSQPTTIYKKQFVDLTKDIT